MDFRKLNVYVNIDTKSKVKSVLEHSDSMMIEYVPLRVSLSFYLV